MEEALHDVPLYREFAGLCDGVSRLPDERTPDVCIEFEARHPSSLGRLPGFSAKAGSALKFPARPLPRSPDMEQPNDGFGPQSRRSKLRRGTRPGRRGSALSSCWCVNTALA